MRAFAALALLALLAPTAAADHIWDHDDDNFWESMEHMWGGIVVMLIVGILVTGGLLGLIIWAIVALVNRRPAQQTDVASKILDERFARGEIDEDEYRRRKQELRP